jgi:phosphoglycerate dehydrogenase-like enzyme
VLRESDVILLHRPLIPAPCDLVDRAEIAKISMRVMAGAGFDVLAVEAPPPDRPLLNTHTGPIYLTLIWSEWQTTPCRPSPI